jgi:hypothetical protein
VRVAAVPGVAEGRNIKRGRTVFDVDRVGGRPRTVAKGRNRELESVQESLGSWAARIATAYCRRQPLAWRGAPDQNLVLTCNESGVLTEFLTEDEG